MTALTQQVIAAAIVVVASAYLARRAWSSWRAWRATGDERAPACGTGCGCGEP